MNTNTQPKRTPPSSEFDPAELRAELNAPELSVEQQDQILLALYEILRKFVDIGFGIDAVQLAIPQVLKNTFGVDENEVEIVFNRAANDNFNDLPKCKWKEDS